jgi:hypothetical protein
MLIVVAVEVVEVVRLDFLRNTGFSKDSSSYLLPERISHLSLQ